MKIIRGIYSLPSLNHVFVICSLVSYVCNSETQLPPYFHRRDYVEFVIDLKKLPIPPKNGFLTSRFIDENDFLMAIGCSSSSLELLTIKAQKNHSKCISDRFYSEKNLCSIDPCDVLEIFI